MRLFWDKEAKAPNLPADDEIVQGVMLTRGGAVVHRQFAGSSTSAPAAAPEASTTVITVPSETIPEEGVPPEIAQPATVTQPTPPPEAA
jgi:hypothetical protein